MKKIFVLYVCFCLLFSQSVFGIEEIIIKNNKALENSDTSFQKGVPKKSSKEAPSTKSIPEITTAIITSSEKVIEKSTSSNTSISKDVVDNVDADIANIKSEGSTTTPISKSTTSKTEPSPKKLITTTKKEFSKQTKKDTSQKTNILNNKSLTLESLNNIRLNEILANPIGPDTGKEFIELYNFDDKDVNFTNVFICDKTEYKHFLNWLQDPDKKHKCFSLNNKTIKSHEFFTLYNKKDFKFILNNSNESVYLTDEAGNIISKYSYTKSTSGLSWNFDEVEWYKEVSTPNEKNIPNPLTKNYPVVYLNEILPNPVGDEKTDEFIELYNPNNFVVDLKNYILRDASKTGKYLFTSQSIKPHTYLTIYRNIFGFALNNSGNEIVRLIAPNTKIISSISYSKTRKGLSYNYDDKNWYWEQPTPNEKNIPNPLTREYPAIYLNEILPNPSNSKNEFIEIYNPTNKTVSLKNWVLKDASKTGKFTFTNQIINPQSYFVIYKENFGFALNNSGNETVSLIAPNNKIVSSLSYTQTHKDMSLNRAKKWYFANATPGAKNESDPKTKSYLTLQLTEVLPNPIGDESTDEFIEIYNPNNTTVDLKYWSLKDASKTGNYSFVDDRIIKPKSYLTIYRKDFKFALNNGSENVYLIAPNDKITDSVSYKTARENISYNYDFENKKWRWSKYLTPNNKNIFNNLPQIVKFKIDKKSYKNVYTEFNIKATDVDGEKLKVRWDFGDGHKSYLWKTRHKYIKTGAYTGNVRIQDGSEEIIKNFTVIVKKYPKYKIEIIKILPNPSGKDSGAEYIVLKNNSKKKINLQNWSIATGSTKKTLVNHPINKKLILKPDKTKIITKKYSALTLPNKTGVVEVRRPNKSVSDKLKYGEKNISIPDNAIYKKIDKDWQWIVPIDTTKQAETQVIIAQALKNEQFFSQQKLESVVAYNAVYNSPKATITTTPTNSTKTFSALISFINTLLNKVVIIFNNMKIELTRKNTTSPQHFTPYKIPTSPSPCSEPTLYISNKFKPCNF